MKVISLNNHNTNTNTLNVNFNGTISQALATPAVTQFFSEVSPEDIVSIDGADTSAISGSLGDIVINDDTVLEVAKFGEATARPQEVPTTGHVFVSIGGGFASKKVLITNGVTTVKQVLTEKLANAFASTQAQLQAMNISVNDVSSGLCTVLKDGDAVVLEARKAGSKGSDTHAYLTVVDANGNEKQFDIDEEDEDLSLEEFLDLCLEDEVEDGLYTIEAIDDEILEDLPESFRGALLTALVGHYDRVVIAEEFLTVEGDIEEVDEEEFTAEGTVAPAQPGIVTVSQAGSCQPIKVAITGNTTVKDVVTSSKVLNTLAMSADQILGMRFHVNDVEAQTDARLHNGDMVVISARNCGSKGC